MPRQIFTSVSIESDRERVKKYYGNTELSSSRSKTSGLLRVIFPWVFGYKAWWGFTVFAAIFTVFFETYQIAFSHGGLSTSGSLTVEIILLAIFVLDIIINFNLAYYDDNNRIIFERRSIAKNYTRCMFWVDLIGVFPFYAIALQATGNIGVENQYTQNLGLLRLFKMVRLHRVAVFFSIIQYSSKLSLMSVTLLRNLAVVLVWTHTWACVMFFVARETALDSDNTWLGTTVYELSEFEQYITSLYWSVVTFTTVGYGDFSPVNSIEQIFGVIFMLLNVVIGSWMIGSITLLIVKSDEKTSLYRETLQTLYKYASINNFDKKLTKRLRNQLKLDFDNKEVADEQILQFFPTSVRRRILRKLYLPSLLQTRLMMETRQHFVDAFLSLCSVEIFSPGEEILLRGSTSSDLYLLLDGQVEVSLSTDSEKLIKDGEYADTSVAPTSVADSSDRGFTGFGRKGKINYGEDFLNDLGFFTESPEADTIRTTTVCKVLTMSKANYKDLSTDHPGSAAIVLKNLLNKVEDLSQSIEIRRSSRMGVCFDVESDEAGDAAAEVQAQQALVAIQELVRMQIDKQKDDHTTRFCFAASRGDEKTIVSMCEQGFDPDSSDYDQRTALMVASMNGNCEVVTKLLEYHANPNLVDMHGVSALYEATRNNNEDVAKILLQNDAKLSMNESLAASKLCQTVFDGDTTMLKRLLKANIQVNASDYDKRTACHIAASEGNAAALKLLVEAGADTSREDRWGNTARSEAERAKSGQVLEYLDSLKK